MPGASAARPGMEADRAATVAAAEEGGFPRTDIPNPPPAEAKLRRLGGVGRRGAVWVMGCWVPMLATAMAGAASERATVSSGISAVWGEKERGREGGRGEGEREREGGRGERERGREGGREGRGREREGGNPK